MPKFFVKNIDSDMVIFSGEDFIHLKKVLRYNYGDNILISDCKGFDYVAIIERIEISSLTARIVSKVKNNTETFLDIVIYQSIPKMDKMDFIIQKCVELGAKKIVPMSTERTIVKIVNEKDAVKKTERWQKIALEAAKQSNRGIIPEISKPVSYLEALENSKSSDLCIIPYEKETVRNLKTCLKNTKAEKISVFIGPEGGFSEQEIQTAVKYGVIPVTLGSRILRTETATIAMLSILVYELGDVNV